MRESWAPGIRGAALLGGAMLSLYGMRQRSLAGCALTGAGLALALRAALNQPITRLAGLPSHEPWSGAPPATSDSVHAETGEPSTTADGFTP
jgi:uncharacterized membrane protein